MSNLANRLQIRHLRLIGAIAETGQLVLAAERLSMTQPAASRMLAEIERDIGMALFDRHPKGMTPTAAGEALARAAFGLLNSLDETLKEVDAIGSGRAGSVRVGAVTGAAVAFVVPAIQALKRAAPGAEIHVDVAPSDVLIDGLMNGIYDFVLSRLPSGIDASQFHILRGRVEVIRFLVRGNHRLARAGKISLAELAGYEWVIQAAGTPLRQAIEEALLDLGIALPRETVNTTSLLVMIAYLSSSDAIAPVSREVAELFGPGMSNAGYVALETDAEIIVNPYHLVSRKIHVLGPLAARLRDLVFAGLSGGAEDPRRSTSA